VLRSGREVQPFARVQGEIAVVGVEDDRSFEAEQDLVIVVLMPAIAIAWTVAPSAWR
jgi:hypothetical protein